MSNHENCIEWLTGQDRITCSLTQKKHINKVKRMATKYPNEVEYTENNDGSIVAHVPLKALKLSIIKGRGVSAKGGDEDDGREESVDDCE